MHESCGSLSSSMRSVAHSSTTKAAPTATRISGSLARACYGARPHWVDKLLPRGVDQLQPRGVDQVQPR